MSPVRHTLPILICLAAFFVAPAGAGTFELDDDDVGIDLAGWNEAPAAATVSWPDKVVVDASSGAVLVLWAARPAVDAVAGRPARAMRMGFEWIERFELQRATPLHPDELVMVGIDDDRFLVARGGDAAGQGMLARTVTGRPLVELASTAEWPLADPQGATAPPVMVLGSIDADHLAMVAATDAVDALAERVVTGSGAAAKQTSGYLDKTAIDSVVKARMGNYRRCYQRELQRNPSLSGRVVMRFVIDGAGQVGSVVVKASELGNTAVEDCLADELGQTTFPKPQGGAVTVSYPFLFSSG
jgi:hypothetical protein